MTGDAGKFGQRRQYVGDMREAVADAPRANARMARPGDDQRDAQPALGRGEFIARQRRRRRARPAGTDRRKAARSEEHTSELQALMRISYAVFCWINNKTTRHYILN